MKKSEWFPGVYEQFMETALDTYEFQKCQRSDGSIYGTGGTCRKGTPIGDIMKEGDEESLRKKFKAGKVVGGGAYGDVSLTSDGNVIKKGQLGQDEIKIQQEMAKAGIAPDVKSHVWTAKAPNNGGARMGIVEMSLAKGKPYEELEGTLTDKQKAKAAEAYLKCQKTMHMKGIAHGDFHEQNFFFDTKTGKGTAIDFGLSERGNRAALAEAVTNNRLWGRGDWIQRTSSSKVAKWDANLDRVVGDMEKRGHLTPSGRLSNKMTEKQYQEYLERIYGGF